MTTAAPSTALVTIQPAFTDAERLALAGFLAGYRGLTREACTLDLRQFTGWCRARSLDLFAVRRADIEGFARDLEARGRARATVTRRLCTIAGFYKYALEEELIEHPLLRWLLPRGAVDLHAQDEAQVPPRYLPPSSIPSPARPRALPPRLRPRARATSEARYRLSAVVFSAACTSPTRVSGPAVSDQSFSPAAAVGAAATTPAVTSRSAAPRRPGRRRRPAGPTSPTLRSAGRSAPGAGDASGRCR
jgi:hypothetical protein